MGKNLANKFFDKVRRGALIAGAVASIGLASCDLCVTPPKPNYAPQILEPKSCRGCSRIRNKQESGENEAVGGD